MSISINTSKKLVTATDLFYGSLDAVKSILVELIGNHMESTIEMLIEDQGLDPCTPNAVKSELSTERIKTSVHELVVDLLGSLLNTVLNTLEKIEYTVDIAAIHYEGGMVTDVDYSVVVDVE